MHQAHLADDAKQAMKERAPAFAGGTHDLEALKGAKAVFRVASGSVANLVGLGDRAQEHYFRRRFTITHELRPYMLHNHLTGSGADDAKAYRSTPDGIYNENMKPQHETEAKSLLPVSLLPKSDVTGYATVGASIRDLAQLLQVSPPAMRMRLDTLGIAHNGERVAGSAEVVNF